MNLEQPQIRLFPPNSIDRFGIAGDLVRIASVSRGMKLKPHPGERFDQLVVHEELETRADVHRAS